jgi:Mrr N-terminal domain
MPRVSEKSVGIAVLKILAGRPNGEATVEVLKAELPKHIALSPEDTAGSPTRTNEEVWEQQVRNLNSHKNTNGNIFNDGFVEIVSRGNWRITEAGRAYLSATVAA